MSSLLPKRIKHAADFGRVALLVGGESAEREVSLNGGASVARSFERSGIAFEVFDGAPPLFAAITAGRIDRVFNLMHGPGGEDGAVQGALQLFKVPVTGSDVLGSALSMDKVRAKWVFERQQIPTSPFAVVDPADYDADALFSQFEFPLFTKPTGLGSSIGVSKISSAGQLPEGIALAARYSREVIVEQGIAGKEYFTGILDGHALPLIRIETPRDFYDYAAKYTSGDTSYHCPCGLSAELEAQLQQLSLRAFQVLGCSGWGRVDFILDAQQRPWVLEVNTSPGMTDHSLVPQAAATIGIGFDELVWRVLETSL